MLPAKTTYKYYLVHTNSGLDVKMRLSDEWILTKPLGANSFVGEMRELFMGKESGCEFMKKKPEGFRKFMEMVHFPFVRELASTSRIKLFTNLSFPAFKGVTLTQFRNDYVKSIQVRSKIATPQNQLTVTERAMNDDSFKIGLACFHETTIDYSNSAKLPSGSREMFMDEYVLFLPADQGKRWVEMRVNAQFKSSVVGEVKPSLRDIVSHMEVVGEQPPNYSEKRSAGKK